MLAMKKVKRLESKKRKAAAFLDLVVANEEDKAQKVKVSKLIDDSSSDCDGNSQTNSSEIKKNDNNNAGPSNENKSTIGSGKRNLTDEEYAKLKADIKARQKAAMELPKLFLTLDKLVAYQSAESLCDGKDSSSPDLPPLFMLDIQHLLLYAVQGGDASCFPRWCKLLRSQKVSNIAVVVLKDVAMEDYKTHRESFGRLDKMDCLSIDIISPYHYGSTVEQDIFKVPLSCAQIDKLKRSEAQKGRQKETTEKRKQDQAKTGEGTTSTPGQPSLNLSAEKTPDAFSRKSLLLTPFQMIQEGYPLPVEAKCQNYLFTKEDYSPVTENSPLFGVDCEMCQTSAKKLELTRVAVVREDGQVVYDTLVKPYNVITNYLTRWSGITKKKLKGVTTRLEEVQQHIQSILPPDAILCGQSLQGDLNALQMFHPYCIDTSVIYNLTGIRKMKPGLKKLAAHFLGRDIQEGSQGHSPVEDAKATLDLVLLKLSKSFTFGDVVLGGVIFPQVKNRENQSETQQKNCAIEESKTKNDNEPKADDVEMISSDSNDTTESDTKNSTNEIETKQDESNSESDIERTRQMSQDSESDVNMEDEKTGPSVEKVPTKPIEVVKKKIFFSRADQEEYHQSFFDILEKCGKSCSIVDEEHVCDKYKAHNQIDMHPSPMDPVTVNHAKNLVQDKYFTWAQFNSFSTCLSREGGEKIEKHSPDIFHCLDKWTNKIYKKLPECSLLTVILTGRKTLDNQILDGGCFVKLKRPPQQDNREN